MIHIKCQDLFSLKNKKIFECRLLQILIGALRVNVHQLIFTVNIKLEVSGNPNGLLKRLVCFKNEPAHDKTYNKTCETSEDSDQTAHPCSLISVFADCMCLLQPLAIQRGINENPCHTEWMYRLICWSNWSYCRFCRALAHLLSTDTS